MSGFDCFLSHNSKDKPAVRELARRLEGRGIRVWLDEEQLIPGRNVQPQLEKGIRDSATGAVLVGGDGLGPWEDEEMQALLGLAVEAGKPVIPVMLRDAPSKPELPLFLRNKHWVDLRSGFTDEGIDRLIWGIKGERLAENASSGEYAGGADHPLAKILDHTDQLAPIRKLLAASQANRLFALIEAGAGDWPSYLADHLYLDPWPEAPGSPPEATQLGDLNAYDDQAFWSALVKAVPRALQAPDDAARRALVRDWINGAALRVLYVPVSLERQGRRLHIIIRGAEEALAGLGDLAPGTRILVLFGCFRKAAKAPFWWPLYARFKLAGLERCCRLGAMRLLEAFDIEAWYSGFPPPLRPHYNRDQLKAELLALFQPDRPGIRYELARHLLMDEDALRRARVKP